MARKFDLQTYTSQEKMDRSSVMKVNRFIKEMLQKNIPGVVPAHRKRWLPKKFQFVWMTPEGNINKRIWKHVKKDYNFKIPDPEMSQLGQLTYHLTSTMNNKYYFVKRKINWKDGEFSKSGSCLWNSKRAGKLWLNNSQGFGLCFYEENNLKSTKIGRCLGLPYKNGIFLFNAYGKYKLKDIALFYSKFLNYKFKRVKANHVIGDNLHKVWFNNDGGFLLAPPNDLKSYDSPLIFKLYKNYTKSGTIKKHIEAI